MIHGDIFINHGNWIIWVLSVQTALLSVSHAIIAKHKFDGVKLLNPGLAKKSLTITMFTFILHTLIYALLGLSLWFALTIPLIVVLTCLCCSTWWYVGHIKSLRVVYEEVHDGKALTQELEKQTNISKNMEAKAHSLTDSVDKLKRNVAFGIDDNTNPKIIETINQIREEIMKVSKGVEELKKIPTNGSS